MTRHDRCCRDEPERGALLTQMPQLGPQQVHALCGAGSSPRLGDGRARRYNEIPLRAGEVQFLTLILQCILMLLAHFKHTELDLHRAAP